MMTNIWKRLEHLQLRSKHTQVSRKRQRKTANFSRAIRSARCLSVNENYTGLWAGSKTHTQTHGHEECNVELLKGILMNRRFRRVNAKLSSSTHTHCPSLPTAQMTGASFFGLSTIKSSQTMKEIQLASCRSLLTRFAEYMPKP